MKAAHPRAPLLSPPSVACLSSHSIPLSHPHSPRSPFIPAPHIHACAAAHLHDRDLVHPQTLKSPLTNAILKTVTSTSCHSSTALNTKTSPRWNITTQWRPSTSPLRFQLPPTTTTASTRSTPQPLSLPQPAPLQQHHLHLHAPSPHHQIKVSSTQLSSTTSFASQRLLSTSQLSCVRLSSILHALSLIHI